MRSIVVRDVTVHDMKRVNEVVESAFRPLRRVYRPTRAARKHKQTLETKLTRLVAVADGVIVGTLQYYRVAYEAEDDQRGTDDRAAETTSNRVKEADSNRLHLLGLAVHHDYQRKGVARCLLEALTERAAGLGVPKLSLCTIKETGNVPVLLRLGFSVVSEQRDAYAESDLYRVLTDVYLEKRLTDEKRTGPSRHDDSTTH